MPIERRCLAPGCDCTGYVFDIEKHKGTQEEVVETQRDELKIYCSRCGHPEEEHELPSPDQPSS